MVEGLKRWDSIQVRWSIAEGGISAGRVGDTKGETKYSTTERISKTW